MGKRKRWHSPGVLAPPYVNATLLTASPNMSQGRAVKSEAGQVLHMREAILHHPYLIQGPPSPPLEIIFKIISRGVDLCYISRP